MAVAEWYVKHLGFHLARHAGGPGNTHFLADEAGHVVLDYQSMHPLMLHVAFVVEDMAATHERLCRAGAVSFSAPETSPSGDQFAMLRDPFGLPLQLVRRKSALVP